MALILREICVREEEKKSRKTGGAFNEIRESVIRLQLPGKSTLSRSGGAKWVHGAARTSEIACKSRPENQLLRVLESGTCKLL